MLPIDFFPSMKNSPLGPSAAGIGGIAVKSTSLQAVSWIGAVSVAFAAIMAILSFSLKNKTLKYKKAI
ncbi:hypothetical protein [Neobacillus dielmonensis]|uniref:hypothetical protein n=1 Tax=Neobacillus dielmonensis TaxID=1347369 RepID=UPI0005A74B90|nr:hypothetical protein [Neobacillus dielmonensis]